jgi:hypothetical protein
MMRTRARKTAVVGASVALELVLALSPAAAWPQSAGGATISVAAGPHKGEYSFTPSEGCVIASFDGRSPGISVVMTSTDSSLSVSVPSIDDKHASEIQIVLVIADGGAGEGRKGPSSVTYEIDTRPDATLEPYQRAERANKGMTGKATTTLMQQGDRVLLSFSGETANGMKLEGSVTCRKMG